MIINNIFVKCASCVTTLIAINMRTAKWLKYDGNMHWLDGRCVKFIVDAYKADKVPLAVWGIVKLELLTNGIKL